MGRKLDPKAIEANRRKKQKKQNNSEAIRQEIREAAEQHRENPRTYEIPPPPNKHNTEVELLNACGYVRVSTPEEEQAGSLEVQIQELTRLIESNPKWKFCGIYVDDGISGTLVEKRKGFQDMIEAAKNHEVDLIITKDMSRFGRNCSEVLENLRLLRNLKPAVGVVFHLLGITSLDPTNELLITILAAVAQLESQQRSISIKESIRNRMKLGTYKFSVVNTLGYYRDTFGRLKIDEAEAEIVKYIYEQFLEGVSPTEIANALTSLEIATPKGLYVWPVGTIHGILRNEKYNGNALMHKWIVKDYLTHRSVKNDIISTIMAENHHDPIIKMEDWQKAQMLLDNWKISRFNRKSARAKKFAKPFFFPRVKSGALRGYYLLDLGWTRKQREHFLRSIVFPKNNKD